MSGLRLLGSGCVTKSTYNAAKAASSRRKAAAAAAKASQSRARIKLRVRDLESRLTILESYMFDARHDKTDIVD